MAGTFRVGLLGHGTVGGAFAALLEERADAIAAITGLRPVLSGVLTRSRGDFEEILEGSDLIVELIGGIEPARAYVLRAMRAGRHVVSANKQLLSQHGEELWAVAREHQVQLRFEGAVAGVVPVIRVLQESLAAAHVDRLHGIVNGTTNFILTRMAETGASYDEALAEAQRLGYAEADLADRVGEGGTPCAVVGKHCESGDVLIRETALPEPRRGDVLVTPVTGAYGYAMANNYNGVPRPPVIFCSGGDARVVVRRETYEDLHGRDL